jgi:transposase
MLTQLFFPGVSGVRVDQVCWEGHRLHLTARTTRQGARCPLCGRRSKRMHSRYWRTMADLPCAGAVVTLHLWTRRFVCRVRWCRRKIFTERLPTLVAAWARRTGRLREQLQRTGVALGGAPGARHATAAGMPVSRRTLLRLVLAAPTPEVGPVRVVGVDDWSQKRGRTYGTILVDLETHRVIDVLPDRTAATLAAWLRQHPEIEVVSRDRAEAYADGIRQGAPQAVQVADRFHLLKNVTDSVERFLRRKHRCLRQAAQALAIASTDPAATEWTAASVAEQGQGGPLTPPERRTRHDQAQQESRTRRLARYDEVMTLHAQGHSLRAVAQLTGLARNTVRRYVRAEGFPECQPRRRRSRLLDPFVSYVEDRWAAGCQNVKVLDGELRQRGYRGGYTRLKDYVRAWRGPSAGPSRHGCQLAPAVVMYSSRQTLWLLLRPDEDVTTEERAYLMQLYHACPHAYLAQALALEFATVLHEHDVPGLYEWLRRADSCPIAEIAAVARGMWLDKRAIEAAVALEWSNGQVEGSVNKLKVLKRAMYGRAHLDLLRQRLLYAA